MKYFTDLNALRLWFDARVLDDETAYVKDSSNKVICASEICSALNIYVNENLDNSLLMSNIIQMQALEDKLVKLNKSGVVYEIWNLEKPKLMFWEKKILQVGTEKYFLCQLSPLLTNINKSLLHKTSVIRNWSYPQITATFTEKELSVLYLSINGFSSQQIGEFLYLSPGTIKTHLYNKVGTKLREFGFQTTSKQQILDAAIELGLDESMPSYIVKKLTPSTDLIRINDGIIRVNLSELDLRV